MEKTLDLYKKMCYTKRMILTQNKYTPHYLNLMNTRSLRLREPDAYYERHHIVPKSIGGSDDESNLVYLTAKEHFAAHLLLTKITEGQDKIKMLHAFGLMKNTNKYKKRITSRLYQVLKEELRVIQSEANKGKTPSDETKRKMSEANKGNTPSDETRRKLSEARKGKTHSEETKRKMSEAAKGKTHSDETRRKMSESKKGIPRPKHPCQHCGKKMATGLLTRWHNENCKENRRFS